MCGSVGGVQGCYVCDLYGGVSVSKEAFDDYMSRYAKDNNVSHQHGTQV